MASSNNHPFAGTRLVRFLERRILELRPTKTQLQIAREAGFRSPNMLAMIKSGASRLPLDRVPKLAAALDCDGARLFRLAIEQMSHDATSDAVEQIFGSIVTANERAWIEALREASDHSDPSLTATRQRALRAIFSK